MMCITRQTVLLASFLIFAICNKVAVSWTIDLPEARRHLFEHNKEHRNEETGKEVEHYSKFYDNIDGDSPHNTHHAKYYDKHDANAIYDDNENYGDDYDYQNYMEKKVHRIVHHGSLYLEGLRQAIQRYSDFLRNCSRVGFTANQTNANRTWMPEMERPRPSNMTLSPPSQNASLFVLPQNESRFDLSSLLLNSSVLELNSSVCERATRASEHVRRLADLALWVTSELQDKVYDDKYTKEVDSDREKEQNELVLRLAWLLDRLALYTGFEPHASDYATPRPPRPTTSLPTTVTMMPTMMTMPDDNSSTTSPPLLSIPPMYSTKPTPSMKDLPDYFRKPSYPPSWKSVKSVKKRSIDDNPLLYIMKYYAKHKAWVNDNSDADIEHQNYDVNNVLTAVRSRRSTDNKKGKIHLLLPENPMQDISQYVKHKKGVRYVKDENQAAKLKQYLEKIRHKKNFKKMLIKHKSVQKRSIKYRNKFQPRESENPMQDISYYIKNKPGTNNQPDLVQAAQVRVGLEQVYQTGNIEVVRRYGSNYNPAVPSVLTAGAMRSFSDV